MNKDIVRKISETSTPADLEDIKYMREIVKILRNIIALD